MLQQILSDMYIDPELLAELSDEQKQILFCKMREEQVKRYHQREQHDHEHNNNSKHGGGGGGGGGHRKPGRPNRKGLNVGIMSGADGEPWTWVMGEHKDDQTIEEMLATERWRQQQRPASTTTSQNKISATSSTSAADALAQRVLKEQEEEEDWWKASQRRAKEQEEQIRAMARRAREEHRQQAHALSAEVMQVMNGSKTSGETTSTATTTTTTTAAPVSSKPPIPVRPPALSNGVLNNNIQPIVNHQQPLGDLNNHNNGGGTTAALQKPPPLARKTQTLTPRPPKPPSRQAVVEWFKREERPRSAGLDADTNKVAAWFHGIISRPEAEALLADKPVGSFLVRVSERVWGYAVSYKAPERCKHFLVDTSDGVYRFFGSNQMAHARLSDLVAYHRSHPISVAGQEYLEAACGQAAPRPNYSDLFFDETTETTFL